MTTAASTLTVRSGPGWTTYITEDSVIHIIDETDKTATKRMIEDMATWTNPADWAGGIAGETDSGKAVWLYEYDPL